MKNFNQLQPAILVGLTAAFISFAFSYPFGTKKSSNKNLTVKTVKASVIKAPAIKKADVSFDNIEFDFNKASIRSSSQAELDRVVKALEENKASIRIAGHADAKGTYLYNWNLSKKRAQSVKAYLVEKGADESRIAATEFGDTKPIASNKTASGRQKNRRAELAIY